MIEMIFIIALTTILIFIFFLAMKKDEKKSMELVFINEKTKKYHRKECPYSKKLNSITINKAIQEGYTPCKICYKI